LGKASQQEQFVDAALSVTVANLANTVTSLNILRPFNTINIINVGAYRSTGLADWEHVPSNLENKTTISTRVPSRSSFTWVMVLAFRATL